MNEIIEKVNSHSEQPDNIAKKVNEIIDDVGLSTLFQTFFMCAFKGVVSMMQETNKREDI